MSELLLDLLDIYMVVYLDDILIYSDSLDSHKNHILKVLKRLWDNSLYVSSAKCTFHQRRIEFLGFVLSPEGV